MPLSEDEVSLGDKEFIVPEDPVVQERVKRRLIAIAKAVIPAQDTITLWIVPKTKTIPSSQATSGRMGKLSLRNRRQTENHRMTITCLSPKARCASVPKNLSCLRIPSSRCASSAGL